MYLVLKKCGITGTEYEPGDVIDEIHPGSLDSALRMGLVEKAEDTVEGTADAATVDPVNDDSQDTPKKKGK